MARVRDELVSQAEPGRFSPDYAAEQVNTGATDVLARQASGVAAPSSSRPKVSARDANYVQAARPPFICGNCRFIDRDSTLCQIVDGPYDEGRIAPSDTCRLFQPKPVHHEGQALPEGGPDAGDGGDTGE